MKPSLLSEETLTEKKQIKILVRGAYDLQKLRIQTGLRLVANYKVKLGQEPGERETTLTTKSKRILNVLRVEHKRITDGIAQQSQLVKFRNKQGIISDYVDLMMVAHYFSLEEQETRTFKVLGQAIKDVPVYAKYLKGVKGVGPAMAGVIISEIDISKALYPSSLWKYAGLDVAEDGRGRSRRKEHLIDIEYTDKEGKKQTRKGITFNPFLKTKLLKVLGSSFLRVGPTKRDPNRPKGEYRILYGYEKVRLENHHIYKDVSKGHRHNMAIRYMIKRFLVDLYKHWREIEGLRVASEYSEAKLGLVHKKESRLPRGNH